MKTADKKAKKQPTPKQLERQRQKKIDDACDKVLRAMENKIAKACRVAGMRDVLVDYAAYETTADDVPIDNLDQVAVAGKVRVLHESADWGGGLDYKSEVLESPTWLRLAVCANMAIALTNDHHHVFLEGVDKRDKRRQKEPGVTIYDFIMGS